MSQRLRSWYQRTARTYGKERGEFFIDPAPELAGFRRLARVKAGQTVLDVGTGTGRYLIPLARQGAK
ncbi:MAG TPA: hypothetical protein VJB16_07410, partial [archaeon]|nr:hypothetical protein [archaeon]